MIGNVARLRQWQFNDSPEESQSLVTCTHVANKTQHWQPGSCWEPQGAHAQGGAEGRVAAGAASNGPTALLIHMGLTF